MLDQEFLCESCAGVVEHGLDAFAHVYVGDMELLARVDEYVEGLSPAARVNWGAPVECMTIGATCTAPCMACGDMADGRRWPVVVDRVEFETPAGMVRVPRVWAREGGKAVYPLPDDGLHDLVISAEDWEVVIPMLTGWITAGKYASYAERFADAAGRTTDRAAALLTDWDCAVSVADWLDGARPVAGAVDAPKGVELPGQRHAARRERLTHTMDPVYDHVGNEKRAARRDELVSVPVKGVHGVEDGELVGMLSQFEHHVPVTCGWLRMDAGRNTWHSQLKATGGKKFARAIKKLVATGDFELKALATV